MYKSVSKTQKQKYVKFIVRLNDNARGSSRRERILQGNITEEEGKEMKEKGRY